MTSTPARPWGIALLLTAIYGIYVVTSFGVICSNDGSHFATVRALAERGTLRIGDGELFAINDVAKHNGIRYSNKPPGTAIVAVPLYWVGLLTAPWSQSEPSDREAMWSITSDYQTLQHVGIHVSKEDLWNAQQQVRWPQMTTTLTAPLAGVLVLVLLARLLRRLDVDEWSIGLTVLAVGLGSLCWRYATSLFSHSLSAALLLAQIELLVAGSVTRPKGALWWGLLHGLGVAVEYQSLITSLPMIVYWVVTPRLPRADRWRLFIVMSGGLGSWGAWLAWCHWSAFGHPLRTANAASEHFQYAHSVTTMLGSHLIGGVQTMLLSRKDNGLLWVTPCVIPAVIGWLSWPRDQRRWGLLLAGISLLFCVVLFHINSPDGGAGLDHRYLLRIVPIILLPLPLAWSSRLRSPHRWQRIVGAGLLLATLVGLGWSLVQCYDLQARFMKHMIMATSWEPTTGWAWVAVRAPAVFTHRSEFLLMTIAGIIYLPAAILALRLRARERTP